ncbi:MAG TPA: hypothetical protein VKB95_11790 [Chitinophagaceae bacterium]|nr:hypothetical protein [Chitinophagaceae bacterium]
MKIKKINILLAFALGAIAVFPGCKKDDGAIPERVTVTDVPTVTTNLDPTSPTIINVLNPTTSATFLGKFSVANYFPDATPPSKVDIVVRKNNFHPDTNPNGVVNNGNVKLFKAGVTSLPANFTVTAAEIATLFGTAIQSYDNYDFAPDLYVGDRKFEAFPVTGTGVGTGHAGHPLYSEFARFSALCQDANFHQGNFEVVSEAFPNGFTAGQVVVITKISATQFSFQFPNVTSPTNVTFTLATATGRLSAAKQKIGNAFTWDPTQINPNITVTSGATNFIEPCAGIINLNITYTTDQKLFPGTYLLKLRKL